MAGISEANIAMAVIITILFGCILVFFIQNRKMKKRLIKVRPLIKMQYFHRYFQIRNKGEAEKLFPAQEE